MTLKLARPWIISLVLLAVVLLLSVAVGSIFIPPITLVTLLFSGPAGGSTLPESLQPFYTILFALRLPRTILMALVGAALAGSGAAYQGLFRNPLADPYLIGIASGAGLGAVLAINTNLPYNDVGLFVVPLCAFGGAILTVTVVYQLARVGKTLPTTNLILAGVAVSALATSVTSFLMLSSSTELRRSLVWLMGGITLSGWQPVWAILPYVTIGLGSLLVSGHMLNILQFGEEQAQQLGIDVTRTRQLIILAATLTTAAAVSFTGIIGFIGLIVPHLVRLLWGGNYRSLLGLSILNGATLLLLADILGRVILAPQEVPVGIITAFCGAPFFLWVLRQAKDQNYW
jgi:iron complex transport system permease protein